MAQLTDYLTLIARYPKMLDIDRHYHEFIIAASSKYYFTDGQDNKIAITTIINDIRYNYGLSLTHIDSVIYWAYVYSLLIFKNSKLLEFIYDMNNDIAERCKLLQMMIHPSTEFSMAQVENYIDKCYVPKYDPVIELMMARIYWYRNDLFKFIDITSDSGYNPCTDKIRSLTKIEPTRLVSMLKIPSYVAQNYSDQIDERYRSVERRKYMTRYTLELMSPIDPALQDEARLVLKHYGLPIPDKILIKTFADLLGYPRAFDLDAKLDRIIESFILLIDKIINTGSSDGKFWFWGFGPYCDNLNQENPITLDILTRSATKNRSDPVFAFGDFLNYDCYKLSDLYEMIKVYHNIRIDGRLMTHDQIDTFKLLIFNTNIDSGLRKNITELLDTKIQLTYSEMNETERFYLLWLLVLATWLKYKDGPMGSKQRWRSDDSEGRNRQWTWSRQIYHAITDPDFAVIKDLYLIDPNYNDITVGQALDNCFDGRLCMNFMGDLLAKLVHNILGDEISSNHAAIMLRRVIEWDLQQRGITEYDPTKFISPTTKLDYTGEVDDIH